MERISSFVTILHLPDKLVLQIRASGPYQHVQWSRNGQIILGGVDPLPETFSHFGDIYVINNTTMNDLGIYEAQLILLNGQPADVISFVAVKQGKLNS